MFRCNFLVLTTALCVVLGLSDSAIASTPAADAKCAAKEGSSTCVKESKVVSAASTAACKAVGTGASCCATKVVTASSTSSCRNSAKSDKAVADSCKDAAVVLSAAAHDHSKCSSCCKDDCKTCCKDEAACKLCCGDKPAKATHDHSKCSSCCKDDCKTCCKDEAACKLCCGEKKAAK